MPMKYSPILLTCILVGCTTAYSQTKLTTGRQPQITTDSQGVIRLVFGTNDKIFFSLSRDRGITFSDPVTVGEIPGMHLGMTRGPQLATSKDFSVVTAMDKKGNIHSFRQKHKTGTWEKMENVNDQVDSAPEGLMSITADNNNNFYAVWLDLCEGRKNNICVSKSTGSAWSKNIFSY